MVRLFQSETAEIIEAPEPFGVRATLYVVAAFLIAMMAVAMFTRLDRVVSSNGGRIVTTQPTAVVQALDASLIKTIEVREGQRVNAGDVLAMTGASAALHLSDLVFEGPVAGIRRSESDRLQRQHRKHAGHEVQQQPPKQRK